MVALNVDDAARRFHELIDRVARGEAVTIERDGQPIARITPTSNAAVTAEAEDRERAGAAAARLRAIAKEQHATADEIREWIRQGRE